eukprot:TRINITY_DN7374_c0_g1_i2.p1 TRINITY_DN7374_c0_g1~~TRINITY_DN7374_c0_g1_i2.p1  ORF type:complete len:515 (-),score=49.69 TRINITY_DN7374_c0_g1_i2:907-2451(-)
MINLNDAGNIHILKLVAFSIEAPLAEDAHGNLIDDPNIQVTAKLLMKMGKASLLTVLEEMIVRGDFFSEEQLLIILDHTLAGLKNLKGIGIIHRDLKPHNLILSDDGIVKIIDFGVSERIDRTRLYEEFVQIENELKGTELYMAPELKEAFRYERQEHVMVILSAVDLYSLGVTLLQLTQKYKPQIFFSDQARLQIQLCEEYKNIGPLIRDLVDIDPRKRVTVLTRRTDIVETASQRRLVLNRLVEEGIKQRTAQNLAENVSEELGKMMYSKSKVEKIEDVASKLSTQIEIEEDPLNRLKKISALVPYLISKDFKELLSLYEEALVKKLRQGQSSTQVREEVMNQFEVLKLVEDVNDFRMFLNVLGFCFEIIGDFKCALVVYQEMVTEIRRVDPDIDSLQSAYETIEKTCLKLGAADEALRHAEEIRKLQVEKDGGRDSLFLAKTLVNIAELSRRLGQKDKARTSFQQAKGIYERISPKEVLLVDYLDACIREVQIAHSLQTQPTVFYYVPQTY